MSGDDLSFLPKQERKTVRLLLAMLACVGAGFALARVVPAAEAGQSTRMEQMATDVSQLKTNVARIMDRLNIPQEPILPARKP